jgi:hypothetical protein
MKCAVIGLAVVLACAQVVFTTGRAARFVAAGADGPGDPTRAGFPEQSSAPSRRIIEGVPFIAWSEAAELDHNKGILNPSFAASLGMVPRRGAGARRREAGREGVPGRRGADRRGPGARAQLLDPGLPDRPARGSPSPGPPGRRS